jgi:hypothetical protein
MVMGGGYGPMQQHPGWGMWQQQQGPEQWQWQGGGEGSHDMGGNSNGRRETIDDDLRDKIRILNDITFGSDADRQERQLQEQMLKRLQPMIPELAKLIALQQAGMNPNAGGGIMPGGMPAGPMGMNPYVQAGGGMPGMHPMMQYPLAAMAGMNPMMGGGDPGMMGGGGFGGRRRNRGRRGIMREIDYDDDEEDDFGGFGRGRGGGRRRRRGRYNFDDDDLFGDRGGDGEYVEPALGVRRGRVY